jgi:hypothetical protein
MNSVLVALVLLQTPSSLFDQSLAAYGRLPELNARLELSSSSGGRSMKGTVTLLSDAKGLVMRIQQPALAGYERSDRIYRVSGAKLEGYDLVANERLSRDLLPLGSPADRLAFALGNLEEAPTVLLKRERMADLFASLRAMKGWRVTPLAGTVKLSRSSAKPAQQARVVFGGKDHLLRELWMKNPGNELHWSIAYGGPKVAFNPRADARKVAAFTQSEAPPKFADAQARKVYEGMMAAAAQLKSGTVVVKDQSSAVRIAFQGNFIREGQNGFIWLYDGKRLQVYNGTAKRFYTGKARRSDILDLVTACGGEVDAFSRYVLLRRVPFRDILPSAAKLSVGGSMSLNSRQLTILRAVSGAKRFSISVLQDIHLPSSIQVSALDRRGSVVSNSMRTFEYLRLNGSQPREEFSLAVPKGVVTQPLPKLR